MAKEDSKAATAEPTVKVEAPKAEAVAGKKSNKTVVVIVIVAAILLLCTCIALGVGIWWWTTQNKPTPTVTPTADANVTSTVKPTATRKVVPSSTGVVKPAITDSLSDAFNNNANGWTTGAFDGNYSSGSRTITGGVYVIGIEAKDTVYNFVYPNFDDVENFEVSVDGVVAEASGDAGLGLALKITDTDMYAFVISPSTQEYSFYYDSDDESVTDLIEWTSSDLINENDVNTIGVVCLDGTYYLYINDVYVDSVTDTTITMGVPGIVVELYEAGDTATVEFDNFFVNSFD